MKVFHFSLNFLVLISILAIGIQPIFGGTKWEGTPPKGADENELWEILINELIKKQQYYGAMAASYRSLMFFDDLPTKQLAYKTIISLIDKGYPFNTRDIFITGDLDPKDGYNFTNSYNLYKGIINKMKKMDKWADIFFEKIDKENFNKYLFYQAINEYNNNNFKKSKELLTKILSSKISPEDAPLIRKVVRTLARIHFKNEEYEKSYEIYESFLLKLNPIEPNDWTEASWNLFYLKRYEEAIGTLYNMGSEAGEHIPNLEKYVISAATYKTLCLVEQSEALSKRFNKDYGPSIDAIINGKPLNAIAQLNNVFTGDNISYLQIKMKINFLKKELDEINKIDSNLVLIAKYLYYTELRMLNKQIRFYKEKAINENAKKLIMLSEAMKFMKHGTLREKFNPDTVFQVMEESNTKLFEDLSEGGFVVNWPQTGPYWRDERQIYKAMVSNKCLK